MSSRRARRFIGAPGAFAILVACSGCSGPRSESSPTDSGPALCNGGTNLRLAYQFFVGGPVAYGEPFLDQNGRRFLFVDGNCDYWLSGFASDDGGWHAAWSEVRRGTFSTEAAAELEERIGYRTWSDSQLLVPACDGPTVVATNGRATLLRVSGCGGGDPEGDPQVDAVHDELDQLGTDLWPNAEPMSSAIRFRAIHVLEGQLGDRPPAELGFGVAPYSIEEMDDVVQGANGPSFVFTDTATLAELRQLRAQLLAGAFRTFQGQPPLLGTVQQGETYVLVFRDVLPFEDAAGSVESSAFEL